MKSITPAKAVAYYIWFLGACLALLAFCAGCGNVATPELSIVTPSPPALPGSLPIAASISIPYTLPVPGDPAHCQVWLAALIINADEATRIEWDFGDGTAIWNTYSNPGSAHTYPATGIWTVTIRATTTNGRTATASTRLVLP